MHNKTILSLLFITLSIAVWLLARQRVASSNMATAFSPRPLLDSIHQSFVDQFEAYVLEMQEQEPVPALAIAVVKDGQIVFERAWGVRSVDGEKQAIDERTVFRLASLSKGFAPVLAGVMVERGRLHWSDPIVKHVPDLQLNNPEQTQALNLEHVLSHTTGLPRHAYSNLLNMGQSYESILPMLREVPLAHAPGVYYNYQNVVYSLSGDVLERVGAKSYNELMEEYVLDPAGMQDASVGFEAMDSLQNKAYPHRPNDHGYHRIELEPDWYTVAPAAGVNASIRDMGKWLQLLMGYRPDVIADSTLEKIFTPYVSVSTREGNLRPWRAGLDASWYAFGWRVMDYYGQRIIYHGGYVNGYRTEIAFDRERDIGVVILSSAPASFIGHCTPAFFDLYRKVAPVGREVLAE